MNTLNTLLNVFVALIIVAALGFVGYTEAPSLLDKTDSTFVAVGSVLAILAVAVGAYLVTDSRKI